MLHWGLLDWQALGMLSVLVFAHLHFPVRRFSMALFCNDIFDTFTILNSTFNTLSSRRTYLWSLKLAFNTQGDNSYLNELVYAERLLELSEQTVYSLGKILPAGLVKFEFVGNELINSRAVTEVNIFKKRFWNNRRSTQLASPL